MKVIKIELKCSDTTVNIRNMTENALEVRGIVKGRPTRRFTTYVPESELESFMVRAQEEELGVSALSRQVVRAFVVSGLSLSEYKEFMQNIGKKGNVKKK